MHIYKLVLTSMELRVVCSFLLLLLLLKNDRKSPTTLNIIPRCQPHLHKNPFAYVDIITCCHRNEWHSCVSAAVWHRNQGAEGDPHTWQPLICAGPFVVVSIQYFLKWVDSQGYARSLAWPLVSCCDSGIDRTVPSISR